MNRVASIRLADTLALSWSSLRRNRLRSTLTIGAVAIGIAAMMYLISLGLGLESLTLGSVSRSTTLLTLNVRAGSETLNPITPKSIEKMRAVPSVDQVLPKLTVKGELSLDNTRSPTTVSGVDPDYFGTTDDTKIKIGRVFQAEDTQTMIVSTGFLRIFGLDLNTIPLVVFRLTFDKTDFPKVAELKDLTIGGVVDAEAVVAYLPRPYLEKSLLGGFTSYESAKIRVANKESIESTSNAIINLGYKVDAVVDTVKEIERVFYWIQILLGSLGLIAILVASIGMFNTLTISLLERTREIGIMKSLGVKRSDIVKLFMTESLLMGLIGGFLGIGLAFFLQQVTIFALSILATFLNGKVPALFLNELPVVGGFLIFALFIAMATGLYPARRAARINPIEAIRYE